MSEPIGWWLLYTVALSIAVVVAVYLHHLHRVRQDNRAWRERIAPWVEDMEAMQADWDATACDLSVAWGDLSPSERLDANRRAVENEIRKGIPGEPLSNPNAFRRGR
ncbi:hypothetical protein [Agrococcus sp. DT81.2]|uniref:hypothetical protein n=1 Tax=Agrococcus sp. DT81.2 TaxID=3393414 RepID=UPI003CE4DDCE